MLRFAVQWCGGVSSTELVLRWRRICLAPDLLPYPMSVVEQPPSLPETHCVEFKAPFGDGVLKGTKIQHALLARYGVENAGIWVNDLPLWHVLECMFHDYEYLIRGTQEATARLRGTIAVPSLDRTRTAVKKVRLSLERTLRQLEVADDLGLIKKRRTRSATSK